MNRDAIPSIFDHSKIQDRSLKYAKCSQSLNTDSKSEKCEAEASEPNNCGSNCYQGEFVSGTNDRLMVAYQYS